MTDPTAARLSEPLILLPLDTILATALPRDRTTFDDDAMAALTASITATGLRQPVEVWALHTPRDGCTHGLISGHRRLIAFRRIRDARDGRDHTHIPCFVRTPATVAEAMASMIAENELRADLSPWEKGRILVDAVAEGIFDTLDAAVKGLHPHQTRQSQSRLRLLAHLVEEAPMGLTAPETLSLRQCLRLASAMRRGYGALIDLTIQECQGRSPAAQWDRLLPILTEAERSPDEDTGPERSGRPRRVLHLKQGLTIRREMSGDGWILRFSGPEAKKGGLIDDVLDEVERWFQPGFKG
ncbi:MAG: ParB/RepB/Spo0J family partition protein [Gemmobacter sp.]